MHGRARSFSCALLAIAVAQLTSVAAAGEWRAQIGAEARWFVQPAIDARQSDLNAAVAAEIEWLHDWDDGEQRITLNAFARWDENDPRRSHADLRELFWQRSFARAELSVGVKRVFWGVTEALHLVDIVNQTDLVENPDTEDKLGQPMLQLRLLPDWGTWDVFILPVFRERSFPGAHGRLRPPLLINAEAARFEASAARQHVDFALRYSHYIGALEFALSHFSGTARAPRFTLTPDLELTPFYEQTDQTGLELAFASGSWLWKLEAVNRRADAGRYFAATGGFELTRRAVLGSRVDLGLIAEYQYDARGKAPGASAFDDDIVVGGRLALNDLAGSELLLLAGVDRDNRSRVSSLEASRRIGNDWRVYVEARFFSGTDPRDPLTALARDDYWQIEVSRFF